MGRLLTIGQVAEILQLSKARCYEMAASGELPVVKLGRSVRVRRDRLDRWLDDRSR